MTDEGKEENKSSGFLGWWNNQSEGVQNAIILGIFTLITPLLLVLVNTGIDNRSIPTPTPTLTCISADDILVKFRISRNDEVIATLSPLETISLKTGVIVDFEVVITPIKGETLPIFEYMWTDTGNVTNGKLLHSAGRIVDYQSGLDFTDDAISLQLSQPTCPALAPYPFFISLNEE